MNKILTIITALAMLTAPVHAHPSHKDVDDYMMLIYPCKAHVKGLLTGEQMLSSLKLIIDQRNPSSSARKAAGSFCEEIFDAQNAQSVYRRPVYGRDV